MPFKGPIVREAGVRAFHEADVGLIVTNQHRLCWELCPSSDEDDQVEHQLDSEAGCKAKSLRPQGKNPQAAGIWTLSH
eukprot:6028945-Amphidinium_carterae.1